MEKVDSSSPPNAKTLPLCLSDKRLQIARVCVYFLLVSACLLIFVPVVMSKGDSDGYCILYADLYGFGQISACDYCISIAVIFMCMCLLRAIFTILNMSQQSSIPPPGSERIVKTVTVLVDVIMLLLLLVVAALISAGFSHLCDNLFGDSSECDSKNGVGMYPSGKTNDTYYAQLSVAQGAAWLTFCIWFLTVIFEILISWRGGALAFAGKSTPQV